MDTVRSLRALSIGYWVFAGFYVLAALFLGALVILGAVALAGGGTPSSEAAANGFFVFFFALALAWTLVSAVLCVLAARDLPRRRRWTLCFATGCLTCLNAPLGTVLGVFTVVVLLQIRTEFDVPPAGGAPA